MLYGFSVQWSDGSMLSMTHHHDDAERVLSASDHSCDENPLTGRYEVTEDGCWLWQGHVDKKGYGHVIKNGVNEMAHRVSFRLAHGYEPKHVRITCGNRRCINPEHLEAQGETEIPEAWHKAFEGKFELKDDCWECTLSGNTSGYSQVRHNGKLVLAHRLSYELAHGTVPKRLGQSCGNRRCINPDHLVSRAKKDENATWSEDVLEGRYEVDSDTGCWNWKHSGTGEGYGQIRHKGKLVLAHRLSFALAHGHWPKVVRHTCHNKTCINPAHLESGTQAENILDDQAVGNRPRAAEHGISAYTYGCRCDICKAANTAYKKARRKAIQADPSLIDNHGTLSGYSRGCRCKDCREARMAYQREWRASKDKAA